MTRCAMDPTSGGEAIPNGASTGTASERIVSIVHDLYTDKDQGLLTIGMKLGFNLEAPRSKVSVMIVGNHSAGKSSFINWYIGDSVQLESVAMETNSFTFVSHGKRRDTFRGRATIKHKPWLEGIEQFTGAIDNLSTQISESNKNLFSLVDFVDTPGLTDGSLRYPYPVNDIIAWLGIRVNLVLVFFDPHGQALCARTMQVVHRLNQTCKPKTHYFLTMADKIPSEKERSKVILQVAQSLSHAQTRASSSPVKDGAKVAEIKPDVETWLGEHALRVRPILIPEKAASSGAAQSDLAYNRIDEAQQLIADEVKQNVQSHIERLETDAIMLLAHSKRALSRYEMRARVNRVIGVCRALLLLVAYAVPSILLLYLLQSAQTVLIPKELLEHPQMQHILVALRWASVQITAMTTGADASIKWSILYQILLAFAGASIAATLFGKCFLSVMTMAEAKRMYAWRDHLQEIVTCEVPNQWVLFFSDSTYD